MIKKVLKVKFCYDEEELNEFLKKVPLEEYPGGEKTTKLRQILYLPRPSGRGKNDDVEIATGIISVVEYWEFEASK